MKANEFIAEGSHTKISAELKAAIKAELDAQVTSFRTNVLPLGFFQIYDIMNAVAMSNGVDQVDYKHNIHNHDAAAPYTPIERKMLQAAYTAVGQPWDDSILDLSDNPKSERPDGATSPVVAFKGYPK
jgi:hypothetical protein